MSYNFRTTSVHFVKKYVNFKDYQKKKFLWKKKKGKKKNEIKKCVKFKTEITFKLNKVKSSQNYLETVVTPTRATNNLSTFNPTFQGNRKYRNRAACFVIQPLTNAYFVISKSFAREEENLLYYEMYPRERQSKGTRDVEG